MVISGFRISNRLFVREHSSDRRNTEPRTRVAGSSWQKAVKAQEEQRDVTLDANEVATPEQTHSLQAHNYLD